jgi:hypothetical protein
VARAHAKGYARTAWGMAYPNFNPCTREGRVRNIVGCVIEYRIYWHIIPPRVARGRQMSSLRGVLYKRGYYMPVVVMGHA